MSTPQSKFVLFVADGATAANGQPNLTGEFQIAGDNTTTALRIWATLDDAQQLKYGSGKATPNGIGEALKLAAAAPADMLAPPKVDLEVGRVKIWRDKTATAENGRPAIFGYARLPNQYVRLAAWKRTAKANGKEFFAGQAEPYRPRDNEPEIPAGEGPANG